MLERIRVLQISRRLSLRRATAEESIPSNWTTSDIVGMIVPLRRFNQLIEEHQSLQRAEIPSAEGYRHISNGVIYRFLVLELRCRDRNSIWLRLDRRPNWDTGVLRFVLASSKTPNDTVSHWLCSN